MLPPTTESEMPCNLMPCHLDLVAPICATQVWRMDPDSAGVEWYFARLVAKRLNTAGLPITSLFKPESFAAREAQVGMVCSRVDALKLKRRLFPCSVQNAMREMFGLEVVTRDWPESGFPAKKILIRQIVD